MNQPGVQSGSAALRSAFDLAFAAPPPQAGQQFEDLLMIRVAGDAWAVRLRDIVGLVAGPRVTPVPAETPHLLGLAGLRGDVVPVFGLASTLGYAPSSASLQWMLLCGAEEPIALAFSEFEGHLRLPKSSVVAGVATTETGVRAVIDVPLVVATIRKLTKGP